MWLLGKLKGCFRFHRTHQVLLTQPPELLELLGDEELGTSDGTANLPEH